MPDKNSGCSIKVEIFSTGTHLGDRVRLVKEVNAFIRQFVEEVISVQYVPINEIILTYKPKGGI